MGGESEAGGSTKPGLAFIEVDGGEEWAGRRKRGWCLEAARSGGGVLGGDGEDLIAGSLCGVVRRDDGGEEGGEEETMICSCSKGRFFDIVGGGSDASSSLGTSSDCQSARDGRGIWTSATSSSSELSFSMFSLCCVGFWNACF